MKLVTADEMRRMDAATVEKYGVPGMVLMENAGRAVAEAVGEMLLQHPGAEVLIICGKGNNGGDGLVAARHLSNRGVPVQVALLADGSELQGNAAANFRIAHNMGVRMTQNVDEDAVRVQVSRADIIVDAILGIGISGEVHGLPRAAIEAVNASRARVLAVDIPSGINADTGAVSGVATQAERTVTFGAMKLGQALHPGAEHCGELTVIDITIPKSLTNSGTVKANLVTDAMAREMLPPRSPAMHKGDAGRVLVLAGSTGMTGAAALCAQAATRAGAGLVYLGCPRSLNGILEEKCTEAMTVPLAETPEGSLSQECLTEVLGLSARSEVVALGPGLSQSPDTATFVQQAVKSIPAALVIDADGLNCLAGHAGTLAERSAPTVITPHPGELGRLLDMTVDGVQENRVDAARRAAEATGAVVVLKGAATVTAEPGGEVWVNRTGNSGMAGGGMGDVLTGIIAAFLAGGAEPVSAAAAGVYYHGLAADIAAQEGKRGLIAGDLLWSLQEALPD